MTRPTRPAGPRNPQERAQQIAASAALSGAVDLSPLKARAEAARTAPPQAGPAGPGAPGGQPGSDAAAPAGSGPASDAPSSAYVEEVTEATFQGVVEQSLQLPVVLVVWSPRSEQSIGMRDTLARLAAEGGGSWRLGTVEADSQPRIAQALQVQSVPEVRAVLQGQLIGGFAGVQPETELRAFLQQLVEAAGGQLPEGAGPPEDPRVEQAEEAVGAGDLEKAAALYESLLADQPAHPFAADALRQVRLMQRVGDVDETATSSAVQAADAAPDDVELQCTAADLEVAEGRHESAFARLLHVVRTGDDDAKERARTRLVELFAVVGDAEPAVGRARRDLAAALF